jgi:lipopolysaccharide/colanic/teichoic acid biosynthesis glycosyltransferase
MQSTDDANRSPLPWWKRLLDITCCLLALPLLALAALWAMAVTQITAPGPIFFRQERVGYMGRRFFLYKFRTMHVTASVAQHQAHFSQLMKSNAPMQKLDARGDARLIPTGWLMRASGLDELPQIINVLRGEMSIVGPRPCIPYEFELYTDWQRNRLRSVPGLTGLWQVSGKNRTTFEEMIRLDIAYGEQLSLTRDISIMLRTPLALCTQISDTRRGRRQSVNSIGTTAPAMSATYLSNTENVTAGQAEDNRPEDNRPLPSFQAPLPTVAFNTLGDDRLSNRIDRSKV